MDDATETTRRDATGHDATPTIVVSVADAAAMLSISPGAVRKRIERGQLTGRKVSGQWEVLIGAQNATRLDDPPVADETTTTSTTLPDATRHDGQDATRRDATPVVPAAAYAQLAAIRDEWVLPLVERIGELERENGAIVERITHVAAERDQAVHDKAAAEAQREQERAAREHFERERDDLRAEVERLRAAGDAPVRPQEAPGRTESANATPNTPRPWWRFWGR